MASFKTKRFIWPGVITVLFTIVVILVWRKDYTGYKTWKPRSIEKDLPAGKNGQLIKYGYDLVTRTYKYIGPDVRNPSMRLAGNNLACQNCHLDAGRKPGGASFVGVYDRYPNFRKRSGKKGTLEDRINGCMQRSMNGKALKKDSREMKAIVAYMKWLSTDVPSSKIAGYKGYDPVILPDRAADTTHGHKIFIENCRRCHGDNGQGLLTDKNNPGLGYVYPPLWGSDSFNNGAGMNRIITAARFIKGNMPFGVNSRQPLLNDAECYDVAAFIDSHTRPQKQGLRDDYPDRKLKPVDCPYGPYADSFSQNQHKYGPFQPIMQYYKKNFHMK